jgi:hypothetical protein
MGVDVSTCSDRLTNSMPRARNVSSAHVADEALKRLVLHELLIDLRVVLQEVLHHLGQRLIVTEPPRV